MKFLLDLQRRWTIIGTILLLGMIGLFFLFSCTLSFQNIDTHGTATDLVDDTQANTPTISPNINVPVSAMPATPVIKTALT